MKKLLKFLLIKLPLAFIAFSLIAVFWFKWMPVRVTPLMVRRSIEYRSDKDFHTQKKWVPLEKISPNMVKAVIASEDNRFGTHNGFELEILKEVVEEHIKEGKKLRGCSTISQQTAKNVFTWSSDTFVRKAFEAWWTFLIEKIWGKERIMEVYLNVIEMGKGIYGVQAAAKAYYGKTAADLNLAESCMIAVCLPNPITRHPDAPTSYLRKRQNAIISLSKKIAYPDWVGGKKD